MTIDTHAPDLDAGRPPGSAYHRVGGADAIKAVVDRFFVHILNSAELSHYFVGLDEDAISRVKRHQVLMVSHVLGGPARYDVHALGKVHRPMNISPLHFRMTVHLFVGALWEFKVPQDIIFEVGELLASLQPVIAPAKPGAGMHPQPDGEAPDRPGASPRDLPPGTEPRGA